MASKILFCKCLHKVRAVCAGYDLFLKFFTTSRVVKFDRGNVQSVKKVFALLGAFSFTFLPNKQSIRLFPNVYAADNPETGNLRKHHNFIADIVAKTAQAVVLIEVKNVRFFALLPSNGSGFIVEENGLILTNAHVVMNKVDSNVSVKLADGRNFNGIVEDVDVASDLATIRIQARGLPVLKLGSSKDLRPGEWVVAIGSPLSLSNTITAGVISSPHRQSIELGMKNKEMVYIQTDASITFGNSGGPLVNLDGEAIGINCMKITGGISFAIPIDYGKEFLARSKTKRGRSFSASSVKPKYTGVTMITLTPALLQEIYKGDYKVPNNSAVLVGRVATGSPGEQGGLKPGDIVTHVNSDSIQGASDVYKAIETGLPVQFRVFREGMFLDLTIIPEEA